MFLSFVSPTYITELNHLSKVNLYHEFIYNQISLRGHLNLITELQWYTNEKSNQKTWFKGI